MKKYIIAETNYYPFITKGKEYEIVRDSNVAGHYFILNDNNVINIVNKSKFSNPYTKQEMKQPTEKQIIEASKTSKGAKECLEKLFPDLFPKDLSINLDNYNNRIIGPDDRQVLVNIRTNREYCGKALNLNPNFNWEIKTDSENFLCLIPTRKS